MKNLYEPSNEIGVAPWLGIVTTNYDELIEFAIGRYNCREVFQTYGNDFMLVRSTCLTPCRIVLCETAWLNRWWGLCAWKIGI